MKFKEQYEQYVKSVHGGVWSHLLLPYVEWLESLVSDNVVRIEVTGGVAWVAQRPTHIKVVVEDYDNEDSEDPETHTSFTSTW